MLELALFLGLAAAAPGSSVNTTSRAPSLSSEAITLGLSSLSNYTYTSYPSQTATPTTSEQSIPTDYSEQAWSMLWDQVGHSHHERAVPPN